MQKEIKNFITRKIGSTVYVVGVQFSNTSKENFNDKLLQLVKADEANALNNEVVTC